VKIFAVSVLVLAGVVPAHADTTVQTWQVTAECEDISTSYFCDDPANISAVFTTELEPGTFFDGASQETFTGLAPVLMNIVGTYDGLPISFTPPPTGLSDYSGFGWMDPIYPNNVCFGAGGNGYCVTEIVDDGFMSGPFTNGLEILFWNSVELPAPVPEPATILLLTVPLLLGLSKWAQMSLRRLSDR
jgi:hypothetical protein